MRIYGTVELSESGKTWEIKAEPHVISFVKRLWRSARKARAGDTVRLPVNDATAADIRWLMLRYPLNITAGLEALDAAEARYRKSRESVGALLDGSVLPAPAVLAMEPRPYQLLPAALLAELGGLLVADDVGLGKTCEAIIHIAKSEARPALIVTPTALPWQWRDEINRFCPGLHVYIAKTTSPKEIENPTLLDRAAVEPDVWIVTYSKIAGWADYLTGRVRSIILDEIQEVRNPGSQKYQGADAVASAAAYRLGLSATPIHNYGGEIYSVMEILSPGLLGSWSEFVDVHCQPNGNGRYKLLDPRAFGSLMREQGTLIRRTRRDVERELPALTVITHPVDVDLTRVGVEDEENGAKSIDKAAELAKTILATERNPRDAFRASGEFDIILRQLTGIAKAPQVAAFVRMLAETSEKIVLFGWHRAVYEIWKRELADFKPVLYTGSENPVEKAANLARFLNGEARLLIMSLRSGAGVDGIQKVCDTVVIGELDWSPAVLIQDVGRLHRDGQKNPVFAYFLLANEGADPVMADTLQLKRAQLEGLRGPDQDVATTEIDPHHIRRLAEDFLKRRPSIKEAP